MRRRDLLWLFALAVLVRLATAAFISRPGYMDTAYYAAGAVRLARGGGLMEPFLWNYLDDPAGLPQPGFLYWMPLPSLLGAPFAALFPGSFFALQLPFVFLSALLPVVTYGVAWDVTCSRRSAWLSGLLTIFSGLFLPYWTLPETFAPFALFGSLALWLAARRGRRSIDCDDVGRDSLYLFFPLACGVLVGLAHLTRADGILLLLPVLLALLLSSSPRITQHATYDTKRASRLLDHGSRITYSLFLRFLPYALSVILGYLLVMAPWFLRNLHHIGRLLSPAGASTLWLRSYDDLFCYRCDLSLRSYLAWGSSNILRSKLWAASVNLGRFLAENCLVFLLPFVLVGGYRLRRHVSMCLAFVYLLLAYLTHSLAFTFPGPRGGFFHASSAVLPFLFAAGVEGLEATIAWVAPRRHWNLLEARVRFEVAAVVLAMALSVYATVAQLPAWERADRIYDKVDRWLVQEELEAAIVMVGNPPAFWYHTARPAVVVPNGDVEDLLAVADRYGVRYVLLDRNRPAPLAALYAGDVSYPRLHPVAAWGNADDLAVLYAVQ